MTARPFVSVVIPVYNDSGRLKECLALLGSPTYPRDRYEVIVSDNGSTDDVKGALAGFPGVMYTYEPKPGPAAARNRGLLTARGEVIAFTDADCKPDPSWLEKGVEMLLSDPSCGLVGGEITVFYQREGCPTAVEIFNREYFKQKELVLNRGFAATANAFIKREVLDRVGVFDERFSFSACEDRELGERISAAGYRLLYAPESVIRHPLRHDLRAISHKIYDLTIGNFIYDEMKGVRPRSLFREEVLGILRPPFRSAFPRLGQARGLFQKAELYFVILFAYYRRLFLRMRLKSGWKPGRK